MLRCLAGEGGDQETAVSLRIYAQSDAAPIGDLILDEKQQQVLQALGIPLPLKP
jgi:hypothetical protein